MKKNALCIAIISTFFLVSTNPLNAAEKKIIFNAERVKYESGTGVERCRDKCGRRSDPDVKSFLSEGWKIVGSSPKQVTAEHYRYTPCPTCLPHECICFGTEYVLQKGEPAPVIEAKSAASDAPDKEKRAVLHPPAEHPMSELELLKKENDTLKQENALLKKEVETLRKRLGSQQK